MAAKKDKYAGTPLAGKTPEQITTTLMNNRENVIPLMSSLPKGPMFEFANSIKNVSAESLYRESVMAQKDTMSSADAARFSDWVKTYPTMDPRTAVPLALGAIEPLSLIGKQAASADIGAQVQDGSYGSNIQQALDPGNGGVTNNPTPDNGTAADGEQAWWQTLADNITPDKGTFLGDLGDNITPDYAGGDILPLASRTALATLGSGIDMWQAGVRESGGNDKAVGDLASTHGLNEEQKAWLTHYAAPGRRSTDDQPFKHPAGMPVGNPDQPFIDTYKAASPADKAKMDTALAEWKKTSYANPEQSNADTFGQTQLGQIVKDPSLLLADKGSWTPSAQVEVNKQQIAERVWDIRTPTEVARHLAPQAWTPGRQFAHVWYAPDSQAYHTLSGWVDAGVNITADPANVIPMGAAGKLARGGAGLVAKGLEVAGAEGLATKIPGAAARAFEDTNKAVVEVSTNTSRILSTTRRGAAATKPARDAGAQVFDDGRVHAGPYGQYVIPERAHAWLNAGRGARVVADFTADTNAASIWAKTGGRIDWESATMLADAKSPEAVRAVLGTRIGKEIGQASDLGTAGMSIPGIFKYGETGRTGIGNTTRKWLAVGARGMPVSLNDPDTLVRELHALGVASGATADEIFPHLDAAVRPGSAAAKYGAIYGPDGYFAKVLAPALVRKGVHEDDAGRLVNAFEGGLDDAMRDHWNSNVAFGGSPTRGAATLLSEGLGDVVALPSHREILRAASELKKIRTSFGLVPDEMTNAVGDALDSITSVWRKSVLVRPAYALREVGEMAFSMGLSGYDSYFTHPVQAIAMAVHIAQARAVSSAAGHLAKAALTGTISDSVRKELQQELGRANATQHVGRRIARTASVGAKAGTLLAVQPGGKVLKYAAYLAGVGGLHPGMDLDAARVNGDGMWQEFNDAIESGDTSRLGPIADAMSITHGNFQIDSYSRNYARSVEAVMRPSSVDDPVAHRYAQALADRLRRGAGDKDIRNLADTNVPFADALADYTTKRAAAVRAQLNNSRTMKEWADPAIKTDEDYLRAQEEDIKQLTNNDPALLEALATGKFAGEAITHENKALVAHIKDTVANSQGSTFPDMLATMIRPNRVTGKGAMERMNQVSNDFFTSVGEFSDVFARGPLVRQAYARRVEQLGAHMSPAAKAEIVQNLRKAGDINLARRVQAVKATGDLGIDEVEHLASTFAVKESQRIFYDAAKRQNWAYAMRVASPFAQSTVNTFKRWGQMSMANPQSYYRALKPVTALMQPGSAAIYGAIGEVPGMGAAGHLYDPVNPDDSAANGFFYTDRYGERKFAYPLIAPLAQMFGASPDSWLAEGSATSLNVAGTTINPGFGPMFTLPADFVLGDTIHDDTPIGAGLRAAFPYGLSPNDASILEKGKDALAPSFAKKTLDASDPEKMANFTMMFVASLAKSGDYDLSNNNDVNRMNEDAKQLANRVLTISGIFGTLTPSTFNPKILVEVDSPQGKAAVVRYMQLDKLGAEFQKYTKDDYNGGTQRFVDDFGQTALFGALPRTKTTYAIQATNDMWKFATDNPEAYRQNLEVIGLFMSNDDLGSNFAREQYARQKDEGQRTILRPDEYTTKVNEAIGWMLWNQKTKEITKQFGDGTDEAAQAKATVARTLEDQYPGFSPSAKDTGKNIELIVKVKSALTNKAVQTLPSYYYVNRYMQARQTAISMLEKEGTANLNTKGNAEYAAALKRIGDQYARDDQSGGFRNMWNRLLSQELYDPTKGGN